MQGGGLRDSFLVDGVAFKKTFSYAGFEMQPKSYKDPKVLLLNIELELKSEKENAEVRSYLPVSAQTHACHACASCGTHAESQHVACTPSGVPAESHKVACKWYSLFVTGRRQDVGWKEARGRVPCGWALPRPCL